MQLSLSVESSIIKSLDFQNWKVNTCAIQTGQHMFYNQPIKQSLTSTCRVSKRKEVSSFIGEYICYMHSMYSYISLYMSVRGLMKL